MKLNTINGIKMICLKIIIGHKKTVSFFRKLIQCLSC